jgi:O-acetyl-ADP-ribose deacetylase (regulator of RNase III)
VVAAKLSEQVVIRETTGDILTADVEALVNPVNTVGVMGAGLACQVKHTFPAVFQAYAAACRRGELRTGIVIAHSTGTNPRYVVSFPTKQRSRRWVAGSVVWPGPMCGG